MLWAARTRAAARLSELRDAGLRAHVKLVSPRPPPRAGHRLPLTSSMHCSHGRGRRQPVGRASAGVGVAGRAHLGRQRRGALSALEAREPPSWLRSLALLALHGLSRRRRPPGSSQGRKPLGASRARARVARAARAVLLAQLIRSNSYKIRSSLQAL